MIVLAVDTAASLCSACVWDTRTGERGRAVLDLGKGHAEHLMAMIDDALGQAGVTYADLGAIAVAVGPGSFTGVRVGVAAARGLALALKIPAIGITTLEALAQEAREQWPSADILAAIDAGRGQVYVTAYDAAGEPTTAPSVMDAADAATLVRDAEREPVLVGSAAGTLAVAATRDLVIAGEGATADIATYARLAAGRLSAGAVPDRPRPLYLRAADAKPQTAFALPRRDAS